jgi:xylan 1,4-beta-xylosidase
VVKVLQHIIVAFVIGIAIAAPAQSSERLVIDARAATTPFPHFWEKTFGSGRAILSLREDYRDDLRTVKAATGFESIRFHGILMDEVGVYDPDRRITHPDAEAEASNDPSIYNFSYVDQIYDGLLANHVKPFVEVSFMPTKLASANLVMQNFWYHPAVAPPRNYKDWNSLIGAFAKHLIDRYGLDEVATWKFEVWNEPNIEFWAGEPKESTYFELYDQTAITLKRISQRLQVGGPATARAAWIKPFLDHVHARHVPLDFVSTHIYANDEAEAVLGVKENVPREQMVFRAVKMVHDQIAASAFSGLPLIISEYNASWRFNPNITDSVFMGPWLANNIRLCDGLTDTMAYWDFSDVFEENGVVRTPFYGGYGLIAADEIPKPTLNIFAALHKLGDRRIAVPSDSTLATKTSTGLAIALWNYAPPNGEGSKYVQPDAHFFTEKEFDIHVENAPSDAVAEIWRVDQDHSNVLKAFDAMGRPSDDLTIDQIDKLRLAGTMSPPEYNRLTKGHLHLTLPTHGLAVVLIDTQQ